MNKRVGSVNKKASKLTVFILFTCLIFLQTSSLTFNTISAGNFFDSQLVSQEYTDQLYGVEVDISCPNQVDLSGGAEQLEARIENTGMLPETVKLVMITEYMNVTMDEYEEVFENLGPGVSVERHCLIELSPLFQDGETLKLIVTATVEEDPNEKDTDEETVLILAPDLSITNISLSKDKPNDEDTITITASIFNNGHSEAHYCMASYFDNNKLIGEREMGELGIHYLPIGESIDLCINWTATVGKHEIKVIIPRNGYYINPDTEGTSRELSKKIVVEDQTEFTPILGIFLLILAITVFIFIIRRIINRYR